MSACGFIKIDFHGYHGYRLVLQSTEEGFLPTLSSTGTCGEGLGIFVPAEVEFDPPPAKLPAAA